MIRISTAGILAILTVSYGLSAPAQAGVRFPAALPLLAAGPAHDIILARGVGLADRERRALKGKPAARPKAPAPRASSKSKRKPKKSNGTIFNFNTGG